MPYRNLRVDTLPSNTLITERKLVLNVVIPRYVPTVVILYDQGRHVH